MQTLRRDAIWTVDELWTLFNGLDASGCGDLLLVAIDATLND